MLEEVGYAVRLIGVFLFAFDAEFLVYRTVFGSEHSVIGGQLFRYDIYVKPAFMLYILILFANCGGFLNFYRAAVHSTSLPSSGLSVPIRKYTVSRVTRFAISAISAAVTV